MKFLIDFKQTTTTEQINLYIQNNSLTVVSTYNEFDKVYLVSASETPPVLDIVDSVVQDEDNPISLISYPISPGENFSQVQFHTELDTDWWKVAVQSIPDYSKDTQTVERRGQAAIVYVVDSGIKMDHPEFEFSTVSNLYSFNSDFTDYNGHGTAIASLLCGKTCAISDPIVKSVKIFQSGVNTLRSDLVAAFDAILSDVNANMNKFHVVNLSWSIPRDLYLESKIRLLVDRGVWVTAAAGNSGTTIEDVTPACMPEVYTVGAFGPNLQPCDFSNYTGPIVTTDNIVNTGALDVWAPGSEIRIATIDNNYGVAGGTSLATAIQSAAMAYNFNAWCYENGERIAELSTARFFMMNRLSIGKPNLIIKDDKYSLSSNYMTQFLTEYDGENGTYAPVGGQSIPIGSNQELNFWFGPQTLLKEISVDVPLPDGLRIEGRWLRGLVNVSETTVYESPITYTSPSGSTYTKTLKLILSPVQITNESDLSQNVDIKNLYTYCGEDPSICDGGCFSAGPCLDACAGPKGPIPGFTQCYCGPEQQDCQ